MMYSYQSWLRMMIKWVEPSVWEKYFHALEDEVCPKCERHWIDTEFVRDLYLYWCPCQIIEFNDSSHLRHIIRRYTAPPLNEDEELYFHRMLLTAKWKIVYLEKCTEQHMLTQ